MRPVEKPDVPAIAAALAAFLDDPSPDLIGPGPPIDFRKLAMELQVLPVMLDGGGCYGLRPNGQLVSFTWDQPSELRVELDERIQNMAMYRGSLKYPSLVDLVPSRPPSGVTCPDCAGTGQTIDLPPRLAAKVVCYCGGLGWLPSP